MKTNEASVPPSQPLLARRQAALLGPIAAAALLSIKVLLVSDGSPETTLAVLQGLTLSAITAGLVAVALPFLLVLSLPVAVIAGANRAHRKEASLALTLAGAAIFFVVSVPGTDGAVELGESFLALMVAGFALAAWHLKRIRRQVFVVWLLLPYLVLLAFAATLLGSGRSMWLSPESFSLSGAKAPLVGYQLASGDGWTTVLQEQPRLVNYVRSSDITKRQSCRLQTHQGSRTLWQRLRPRDQGRLPKCV